MSEPSIAICKRCKRPCRSGVPDRPDARPFKKAARGLCTTCAVTSFFKDANPDVGVGFALPDGFDPRGLLLPHIQEQFARVLAMGNSELRAEDINWGEVIAAWDIPLPVRGRIQ